MGEVAICNKCGRMTSKDAHGESHNDLEPNCGCDGWFD